jgi:hypothetical protein
MNYKEIVVAAKAYTDRYDQELEDSMTSFTRVVEAKINNALRTGDQSVRSQIWLKRDEEYYSLPCDWGGARDVELLHPGEQYGRTLVYLSPEEMNKLPRGRDSSFGSHHNYYTIIAGQIQVAPPTDNQVLEVVYYQRLPELNEDGDTNWLTEKNPDAYIFGLCTEISAFAKDEALFMKYDARFKEVLGNITQEDQVSRWSGPALRVQIEGLVV